MNLKKAVIPALAGLLMAGAAWADQPVVRVQWVSADGADVAEQVCYVSAEPEGMPPQVPLKVDCDRIVIPEGKSNIVIKVITKKSLEGAIRNLQGVTGN